jgi:hypothetical protein
MSDGRLETTTDTFPMESARGTGSMVMGSGGATAVVPASPMRHRPVMVTILAIGAGILAVLAGLHLLQSLGILPFVIGRFEIRVVSLFYVIMWGLLVWVWIWLIRALWRVDPQAWIFMVVISMFNLIFDFLLVLDSTTWSDVAVSFLINSLVLLYCLLPSTKHTFEMD